MMDDIAQTEATRIAAAIEARIADAIREAEKRGYCRGRESMRAEAARIVRIEYENPGDTTDDVLERVEHSIRAIPIEEPTCAIGCGR